MSAPAEHLAAVRPPLIEAVPQTRSSRTERFGRLASPESVERTVKALERNGFGVRVVADGAAARDAVLEEIPAGAEVLTASSQTTEAIGLAAALSDDAKFRPLKARLYQLAQEGKLDEQRKLGASPAYVVGSVHAITEEGQVLVASASGSQLAPYAFGAAHVIWVVGTQKIVPDLATAFERLQEYTFPRENARAQKAYGRGSAIAKLLVVNREFQPGRVSIVLVNENLGY